LLLEDADEFEQLLAILEDIDHEDCKNSVYKVFANLAQDIDVPFRWQINSHFK